MPVNRLGPTVPGVVQVWLSKASITQKDQTEIAVLGYSPYAPIHTKRMPFDEIDNVVRELLMEHPEDPPAPSLKVPSGAPSLGLGLSAAPVPRGPVKMFYLADLSDRELLDELRRHLSQLRASHVVTDELYERSQMPGVDYQRLVDEGILTADIIMMLISSDFLVSQMSNVEMAMERHKQGEAHVIPVMVRPTGVDFAPFAQLKMIPEVGSVTYRNEQKMDRAGRDQTWADIVSAVLELLRSKR